MPANEQARIEMVAPGYLKNLVMIMTEMSLRLFKKLLPMKMSRVDLENSFVYLSDSKTENGIGDMPVTELAHQAFKAQMDSKPGTEYLFPIPARGRRNHTSPACEGFGIRRFVERALPTSRCITCGTRSPRRSVRAVLPTIFAQPR